MNAGFGWRLDGSPDVRYGLPKRPLIEPAGPPDLT